VSLSVIMFLEAYVQCLVVVPADRQKTLVGLYIGLLIVRHSTLHLELFTAGLALWLVTLGLRRPQC